MVQVLDERHDVSDWQVREPPEANSLQTGKFVIDEQSEDVAQTTKKFEIVTCSHIHGYHSGKHYRHHNNSALNKLRDMYQRDYTALVRQLPLLCTLDFLGM